MIFSDAIKKYRNENNLTQSDLAQKLKVDRTTVIKWEKGTIPRYDKLKWICDVLEIKCDIYDALEYQETTDWLNQKASVCSYTWEFADDFDVVNYKNCDKIIKKDNVEVARVSAKDFEDIQKYVDGLIELLAEKCKK